MSKLLLALAIAIAASSEPSPLGLGQFIVEPGEGGIVVAAPHEGFDLLSSEVASAAAQVLGAGYVAAKGFRTFERPINVNRPTEGARLAADSERRTDRANAVFLAYQARVGEAARGPVGLLIEIHGNTRPESAGQVEIAAVGLAPESARLLKRSLEPRFPGYRVLVEPVDDLHFTGQGTKLWGAFRTAPVALHIELPAALRAAGITSDTGRRLGDGLLDWLAQSE